MINYIYNHIYFLQELGILLGSFGIINTMVAEILLK